MQVVEEVVDIQLEEDLGALVAVVQVMEVMLLSLLEVVVVEEDLMLQEATVVPVSSSSHILHKYSKDTSKTVPYASQKSSEGFYSIYHIFSV
jgi:hypothetical protein